MDDDFELVKEVELLTSTRVVAHFNQLTQESNQEETAWTSVVRRGGKSQV